ncbi:acyclic terpene utilization AtuA family protein [Azospirillum himalayense]|uniref:Acyclic terpene utilization AtuA family protein n=1 Tax=Azospirillum himalayense TaxID=654847 RepID=A0ABW0GDW9_9PROT
MHRIRIGSGAGYSGDRIEPAIDLAERGGLDYLVFECLAERTIALAQQARQRDPAGGYDPLLTVRMTAVLGACRRNGVRLITNMGAANPLGAAEATRAVARSLGLGGLRIAAVTGDDVLAVARKLDVALEDGGTLRGLGDRVISANAYIGAAPIVEALAAGADVVITGRAADPALFLAPMVHEFGWRMDDWDALGRGTMAGHLLECAGQVTGGYFADPGVKDVPELARLGFPIGEIHADGTLALTKLPGTGGCVTPATVKEQLLYEIHDPARYYQPDVVADFSAARVESDGPDRVRVHGGCGTARTGLLKLSIGYIDSCIGEGQISYAGPGAVERGRLALEIVRERLALTGVRTEELQLDLIGLDALHGDRLSRGHTPYEVRLRVAGRTATLEEAARIGNEVETLYTNGPAGGGGAWKSAREIVAVASALLPESAVRTTVTLLEA